VSEALRPARVMIVDDHPILRHGIAALIAREPDLQPCAEAGSVDAALRTLSTEPVDLLIVDLSLEGMSGLELIRAATARHAGVRSLVLSMHDESLYAERALRAGARGYVMKQEATKQIVAALRRVRDGHIYLSDAMASRLLERLTAQDAPATLPLLSALTDRELEVLRLIGRGFKTGDIARTLHRSVHTIEAHRASIKRKLNLKTAAELARLAYLSAEPPVA
jgi:DNA-binding NarL/FixJ family response regulator